MSALSRRSVLPSRAHPFNPLLALRAASLPMDAKTKRALVRFLAEKKPTLDGAIVAKWSRLTPSAVRPGAKR